MYLPVDAIYLMPSVNGVDPDDPDGPRDDVAVLVLSDPIAGATPIEPVEEGVAADDTRWQVGDDLDIAGWG